MATAQRELERESIERLAGRLRGEVIAPGDPGYDAARAVWNATSIGAPRSSPGAQGVADVELCIRTAREHDLPLAVRGGGHNVAGFGTCDGGVVFDLGADAARARRSRRRATPPCRAARPGPTSTPRRRPSASRRPAGIVSTGVAGLTLGGGIGWLKRNTA